MFSFLLVGLSVSALAAGPEVDADQFARLIAGATAEFKDVSLFFEGSQEYVGPRRLTKGDIDADSLWIGYQGGYVYRSDGAAVLDVYERRGKINSRLERKTTRNGKRQPGVLFNTGSPERIMFLWFLLSDKVRNPREHDYQFQGWEEVDGHPCLRVQLTHDRLTSELKSKVSPDKIIANRFWIDLRRGGHPLRCETYRGTKLMNRIDGIQLAQISLPDGKLMWFPIKGVYNAHQGGVDKYYREPLFRETYSIARESIRLNQGLSDERFSTGWREEEPNLPIEIRKLREQIAKVKPRPKTRVDPAGVEEDLAKRLAEADRQSKRLDASSGVREGRDWTPALQLGFGLLGGALLGGAGIRKWRGR